MRGLFFTSGLVLGLAPFCCEAAMQPAPDDPVCIYRFGTTDGDEYRYYATRSQLLADANAWRPRQQSFPGDLRALAERGREHLQTTHRITHPIRLVAADIERYAHSDVRATTVEDRMSRYQCYIVLRYGYYVHEPEPDLKRPTTYTVAILPDGTLAEERVIRMSSARRGFGDFLNAEGPAGRSRSLQNTGYPTNRSDASPSIASSAWAEGLLPVWARKSPSGDYVGYVVPEEKFFSAANYWEASSTPFPADVSESAERAGQWLTSNEGASRLILRRVSIALALRKSSQVVDGQTRADLRECWFMNFEFVGRNLREETARPSFGVFNVVMLLDGTIAEETVPEDRARQVEPWTR